MTSLVRTGYGEVSRKDEEALEFARMMIRLLPTLDALVQQASYSTQDSLHGQTQAITGFVSVAAGLAFELDRPIR